MLRIIFLTTLSALAVQSIKFEDQCLGEDIDEDCYSYDVFKAGAKRAKGINEEMLENEVGKVMHAFYGACHQAKADKESQITGEVCSKIISEFVANFNGYNKCYDFVKEFGERKRNRKNKVKFMDAVLPMMLKESMFFDGTLEVTLKKMKPNGNKKQVQTKKQIEGYYKVFFGNNDCRKIGRITGHKLQKRVKVMSLIMTGNTKRFFGVALTTLIPLLTSSVSLLSSLLG